MVNNESDNAESVPDADLIKSRMEISRDGDLIVFEVSEEGGGGARMFFDRKAAEWLLHRLSGVHDRTIEDAVIVTRSDGLKIYGVTTDIQITVMEQGPDK